MSQHLTQQWLTEIQTLKQQLIEQQQECAVAWESGEKWRKLYNTEAEQRRTDAEFFRQTIASLRNEIQQLKGINGQTLPDANASVSTQQELAQIRTVEDLKAKLVEVLKERDRLRQALKIEQDNHAQTRKSLTTALGDAIDSLARERVKGNGE